MKHLAIPLHGKLPLLLPLLIVACTVALPACKQKALPGGEVRVDVVCISASKAKTPADIAPYDEALAWHEYDVRSLLAGRLAAKRIRVAHWTVLRGKPLAVSVKVGERAELRLRPFETIGDLRSVAASDDLEIGADDVPRFIDIGQSVAQNVTPQALRFDYGGNFSHQMKLYWQLRGRLRLVAMGNSHATKGICTSMLLGAENEVTPVAFNLAPAGANNHQQCVIIRDYVLPLPKIDTVLWVMSPRTFNAKRGDNFKMEEFLTSPGYVHDQKHWDDLWPVPPQEPVRVSDLKAPAGAWVDVWGWEGRTKIHLPPTLDEARPALLKALAHADASFNEAAWRELTETITLLQQAKIRVLLLITPYHPITRETPAVDPDESSQALMHELVRHLEALDTQEAGVWFKDFNQFGAHSFSHSMFYDADHLNRAGARQLTAAIAEWMATCH